MYENEQAQAEGSNFCNAVRPNLRERVSNSLYRAENEASKAQACRELSQLLERNPEVARILELIEALIP